MGIRHTLDFTNAARTIFLATIFGLAAQVAHAVGTTPRTFVSGKGTDSGTCVLSAPCRTFAYALTQTASKGDIYVLDSAGYGPVTITQSVNIINDGYIAGIVVASGNGIDVNAGPNDLVVLRGLTITGAADGTNGIQFTSGAGLSVLNCLFKNFPSTGFSTGNGIYFIPTSTTNLLVSDSTFFGGRNAGIALNTGAATVRALITRSTFKDNYSAISSSGSVIKTEIDDVKMIGNYGGVASQGLGSTTVGRSVITGNTFGIFQQSSTIYTYKDNHINNNGTDVMGTLTAVTAQ